MSNSGCGLQPRPSPWVLDDRHADGAVTIRRTVWRTSSQANPYLPQREFRRMPEPQARAVLRDDVDHPLRQRRVPTGWPDLDRQSPTYYPATCTCHRRDCSCCARRVLADDYARRARAAGWRTGGWA